MILRDRTTALAVEILITDGVFGVAASVGTPVTEPVLSDAVSGKHFKLFVNDGVVGWEETVDAVTAGSITLVDTSTNIPWILKISDEVLMYLYAFTLTTARNSRVSTGITGSSAHGASINKSSKTAVSIALESRVD
jgi:hypothetical protein